MVNSRCKGVRIVLVDPSWLDLAIQIYHHRLQNAETLFLTLSYSVPELTLCVAFHQMALACGICDAVFLILCTLAVI